MLKSAWRGALLACLLLAATANAAFAGGSAIFKNLAGSWRGSGDMTLSDGGRERITCRGYYVLKDGGEGLSLAILCNSTNYKVEMRGNLEENGNRVSGHWEERTFHATGDVAGRATNDKISLSISGYITGAMSIVTRGRSHSVNISARGTGFKSVTINLVRG
jgi:hypothetical protein